MQSKCVYLPSHKANTGDFWAKMAVKKRENRKEGRSALWGKHFTSHRAQGANTIELVKEGREEGEQGGVLNELQFYILWGGKVRSSLWWGGDDKGLR